MALDGLLRLYILTFNPDILKIAVELEKLSK